MYTTIIIDDEIAQQEFMLSVLAKNFSQYEVLCCSKSVADGVKKILQHKPQLVFLDITLTDGTGFDLLNEINDRSFEVIFCTSHNTFAVNAFRVAAVDYLLKPFGKEELKIALDKFEDKIRHRQGINQLDLLMQNFNSMSVDKARVALPTQTGLVVVNVKDIVRCQGDEGYATFFLADKRSILASRNLKECEEMLSKYNFCRVHTSHLINMGHVSEYIKGEGGMVKMTDGSTADVSRRRKEDFLKLFERL